MAGRNVCFQKPKEASFLTRLKEQVGYKEGCNVETKREKLPVDDDDSDISDNEEKPVVVVLKEGDLTEEEADRIREQDKQDEPPPPPVSGKITFKKPIKREIGDNNTMTTVSKRVKVPERLAANKKNQNDDEGAKKVKNKCLLSFDDEEDDD